MDLLMSTENLLGLFDDSDETKVQEKKIPEWDKFKNTPRKPDSGSTTESKWIDISVVVLKLVTFVTVFCVVLGCAVVSKGTLLFMTSQVVANVTRPYCNKDLDVNRQYVVTIDDKHHPEERVVWIWFLIFAYFVPELGTFIRSVRMCLFKSWDYPNRYETIAIVSTESMTAIGSAILVFAILPELDVVKAAMLTNAFCFIPAFITLFSRNPRDNKKEKTLLTHSVKLILDIVCITAQATAFVVWPLVEDNKTLYLIPVSVILISFGWWENFVSCESYLKFIRNLSNIHNWKTKKENEENDEVLEEKEEEQWEFSNNRYFAYIFVSLLKCLIFFITTLVIFSVKEDDVSFIFDDFVEAFKDQTINITEIEPVYGSISSVMGGVTKLDSPAEITAFAYTPLFVWLINIGSTYACYAFAKFACKITIQGFSFALPLNLVEPVLVSILISVSGSYDRDICAFFDWIPGYLFFNTPPLYYLSDFLGQQHAWIWIVWLLSQAWITIHIWTPHCEKLARTEKLFVRPMFDAFLIDQSIALNRRKYEKIITPIEEKAETTRIFACATMWHETREETIEFLKSIMRLDDDQCAHWIAKEEMKRNPPNYYELETNIYFDDAFFRYEGDPEPHINTYVDMLIMCLDEAATDFHGTEVKVRPPVKYPTPYGGRLEWILPGGTKLIAHLKDKKKIRPKKRWSQVMYMYQLLGHRLMDNDEFPKNLKDKVAESTYILALDGDIDFQPEAMHLLVDYMKKNKSLGAACGRIHPVGGGAIAWYQIFEYAVGHWMQKATEHVIGCVLCSPGCFSLFRGKALMDDAVMKKYTTRATEARHYVQYDQGEDRWLCTLLLQRGYRVEYSAASDAYTHCPEGFNEFYNQRRRWMPSTIANIFDLLGDYKYTVKINDNLSTLYMFYQAILMIGTVLGPGTIFLMLIGAFVSAFRLDQWTSFSLNLIPILVFVIICATCKGDTQLFFAGLISAIYGLVMMAVVVGVMLQISQDGLLAPSSLFFMFIAGEFIVAALLHPKEFYCLKYGVIYYVTVPSMYLLLVIYSVFNMNNVSWGTREVTIIPKPELTEEEAKEEKKKEEEKQEKKPENKVLSFFGANPDDDKGSMEFSFASLFKCMLCTHHQTSKEGEQLKAIQNNLDKLLMKLDTLERLAVNPNAAVTSPEKKEVAHFQGVNAIPTNKAEAPKTSKSSEETSDFVDNSWFYDKKLFNCEVDYLPSKEEKFWRDLIDQYLEPIDDSKKKDEIAKDLKDLRDKMVFGFFMLNSLFVLVIFLLTLEKDTIHINWPFNPKINFTYYEDQNQVLVYKEYLHLEPIGFVFLIFFALLLIIQSFGMIIHRFGTFSQIMANTLIDWSEIMFTPKTDDQEPTDENSVKLAKKLQSLKNAQTKNLKKKEEKPDRRKTVHNLANSKQLPPIYDLREAYKITLKRYNEEKGYEGILPRKTIIAIENHKQSVIRKSQAPKPTPDFYDNVDLSQYDDARSRPLSLGEEEDSEANA